MPKKKNKKKLFKFLGFLIIFIVVILTPSVIGLLKAVNACGVWRKNEVINTNNQTYTESTKDISEYIRSEDLTYLTLPEWYIVYSTQEYANFIANNRPSQFPYFKTINQYWDAYIKTCGVVRNKYPFNKTYHFVLGFIGVSFTTENLTKGLYETTLGRLFEFTSASQTDEERYAATVAKEYGDFLHTTPWYFFPFGEKLKGLWTETSFFGKSPIRKFERKIIITLEYGGKYLYSSFTRLASKLTFGGEDTNKIYAVASGINNSMVNYDLEIVKSLDNDTKIIRLTRFQAFNNLVSKNTNSRLLFHEIAGNDEILVTLLGSSKTDHKFKYGQYLYSLPILTMPDTSRLAINVELSDLFKFLNEIKNSSEYKLEHVYDY